MDQQEDWIRWQLAQTGDPDALSWYEVGKDCSAEEFERLCASMVLVNVLTCGAVLGLALIVGIVMYAFGVL